MKRTSKNTKQEIKLAFFYIIDGASIVLASYMPKVVPVGGFGRIMFYVLL